MYLQNKPVTDYTVRVQNKSFGDTCLYGND